MKYQQYLVSIEKLKFVDKREWKILGTGFLIAARTIMTAASCVKNFEKSKNYEKLFGKLDRTHIPIINSTSHPNFEEQDLSQYHDIAILYVILLTNL